MDYDDGGSATERLNALLTGRVRSGVNLAGFQWAEEGTSFVDVDYLFPGDPSSFKTRFAKVDVGITANGTLSVERAQVVSALAAALARAGLNCGAGAPGK